MTDKNGIELKPGDKVLIEATVTTTDPEMALVVFGLSLERFYVDEPKLLTKIGGATGDDTFTVSPCHMPR